MVDFGGAGKKYLKNLWKEFYIIRPVQPHSKYIFVKKIWVNLMLNAQQVNHMNNELIWP